MVQKNEHAHRSSCPLACSLDIIGDHWTVLVIRDLMFLGRHEYKDMLNAEEGISSNILTDRLRRLEDAGLISSLPHPESGRRKLYYLLPKGKDLIYVLTPLARWADKHLAKVVHIPPEKRKPLINNPEGMIQTVLQNLDEWEKKFVKGKKNHGKDG